MAVTRRIRNEFTDEDDAYLVKYIAKYNPRKPGRTGNILYQNLVENESGKWKWSHMHTWQSWRERYKKNQERFDARIRRYQKKHSIDPEGELNRSKTTPKRNQKNRDRGKDKDESEADIESESSRVVRKRKRTSETAVRKKKTRRIMETKEEGEASDDEGGGKDGHQGDVNGKEGEKDEEGKDAEQGVDMTPEGKNEVEQAEQEDQVPDEGKQDRATNQVPRDYLSEQNGLLAETAHAAATSENEVLPEKLAVETSGDSNMVTDDHPPDDVAHDATLKKSPRSYRELIYPDIAALPSPSVSQLPANDEDQGLLIPGAYDTHPLRTSLSVQPEAAFHESPAATNRRTRPSYESSPAFSGPDSGVDMRSPPPVLLETYIPRKTTSKTNHRLGIPQTTPMRTNTLVIPDDSPSQKPLKRRRESVDSDFFISSSGESSPNSRSSVSREPPRLIEGVFGNAFTDARGKVQRIDGRRRASGVEVQGRSGSESEGETGEEDMEVEQVQKKPISKAVWPPRRHGLGHSEKGKGRADVGPAQNVTTNPAEEARRARPDIFPRKAPVNPPIPSTSRLPVKEHHPFSQPSQALRASPQRHHVKTEVLSFVGIPPQTAQQDHHPFSQPATKTGPSESKAYDSRPATSKVLARPWHQKVPQVPAVTSISESHGINPTMRFVQERLNRRSKPKTTGPEPPSYAQSKRSLGATAGTLDDANQLPVYQKQDIRPRAPSAGSDLFFVRSLDRPPGRPNKGKGKEVPIIALKDRRQTFGGFPATSGTPRIDLLQLSNRLNSDRAHRPRQSAPQNIPSRLSHSRRSSSVSSVVSSPSSLSAADRSIALQVGLNVLVQQMSKNHGFTEDIIRRVLDEVNDLKKADALLRQMREGAEAAAQQLLDSGTYRRERSEAAHGAFLDDPHLFSSRQASRKSEPRSELQITLTPPDANDASEYQPPENSRAGQFARLLKQGRKQEALQREVRRASLGGSSPQKVRIVEKFMTRPTPGTPDTHVDGVEEPSPTAHLGSQGDMAMDLADSELQMPRVVVLGDREDKALLSGDPAVIRELEEKIGGDSFNALRRRYVQLRRAQLSVSSTRHAFP